jgi:hypothetical protein
MSAAPAQYRRSDDDDFLYDFKGGGFAAAGDRCGRPQAAVLAAAPAPRRLGEALELSLGCHATAECASPSTAADPVSRANAAASPNAIARHASSAARDPSELGGAMRPVSLDAG